MFVAMMYDCYNLREYKKFVIRLIIIHEQADLQMNVTHLLLLFVFYVF